MNFTQLTHTTNFTLLPLNPVAAKAVQSIDAETTHQIFNQLISTLEGRRFANLPYVLHPKVKEVLRDVDGMTDAEIKALETSIVEGAGVERAALSIPRDLFRQYAKKGEGNVVFDNRIVAVPDGDLNINTCAELEEEFGRADVLACSGFVLDDELFVRLDLDERLAKHGFLIPIYRKNLITGLKVFRHADDLRPFILRSRVGGPKW